MNKDNFYRLKKYLFFISMFCSLILFSHIFYLYIHSESENIPIVGGNISEGIIGKTPTLNPISYKDSTKESYDKRIINMLYRSLLSYNYNNEEKTILVSDLADCEIGDLSNIICYLKLNQKWSNGEAITAKDVIATYNVIKHGGITINNPIKQPLEYIEITDDENDAGKITFKSKKKDIKNLDILMQPIIPFKVLNNLKQDEIQGNFGYRNGVYSGPYTVESLSSDEKGYDKLILSKNPNFEDQAKKYKIEKYIFRIFDNKKSLLENKDMINVFFDSDINIDSIGRLHKKEYFLKKINSLFLNKDRIKDVNLRSYILNKIDNDNITNSLGYGTRPIKNFFFSKDNKSQKYNLLEQNINKLLNKEGYYKKNVILNRFENQKKIEKKQLVDLNPKLKYIKGDFKKVNFLNTNSIKIEGIVNSAHIDEVIINDKKVLGYKKGDKKFEYTISQDSGDLKAGKNIYKIYFVTGENKEKKEEFTIFYSSHKDKYEKLKKDYTIQLKEELDKINAVYEESTKKRQEIESLNDYMYYNAQMKPYTLKMFYVDDNGYLNKVSNLIKNNLLIHGINIEISPININDLQKDIREGKKDYDMILLGLDLGYFNFDIYPYFHSSQSKDGFNFSNIRDPNLDILLEDIKSQNLGKDDLNLKMNKILGFFNKEYIVKPIFAKPNILYIDINNIRGFKIGELLSTKFSVLNSLLESYNKWEEKINYSQKSIKDFGIFLRKIFSDEGL